MHRTFLDVEVARISGASEKQVAFWTKTGAIQKDGEGYPISSVVIAYIMQKLKKSGYMPKLLNRAQESLNSILKELPVPIDELIFFVGDDNVLVFAGEVVGDEAAAETYDKFAVSDILLEVQKNTIGRIN